MPKSSSEDGPTTRAQSRSTSRSRRALGELNLNTQKNVGPKDKDNKKAKRRRAAAISATIKIESTSRSSRSSSRSSGSSAERSSKSKRQSSTSEDKSAKKRRTSKGKSAKKAPEPSDAQIHDALMVTAQPRPNSVFDIDAMRDADSEAFRDYFSPELHQHRLNLEETPPYKPVSRGFLIENGLTDRMRTIVVDWIVESAEDLKLDSPATALAVAILDRSLDTFSTPRSMLPCLACACVLLAGKIEMIYPPSVEDLYFLTDQRGADERERVFTHDDILEYESKICNRLDFRINCVTVQHYRVRLMEAARLNKRETGFFDYVLDLSLLDCRCACTRPSKVAAACLYYVVRTLRRQGWNSTLEYYSSYRLEDFMELVALLNVVHTKSEESSNRAVFMKHRGSAKARVSLVTALRPEQLGF